MGMEKKVFWEKVDSFQKWVDQNIPLEKRKKLKYSPLNKLLWKLNIKVLPMAYQSNWSFLAIMGLSFSVLWHILFLSTMFLIFNLTVTIPMMKFFFVILMTFIFATFAFGGIMLLIRNWSLSKYNIPLWCDL